MPPAAGRCRTPDGCLEYLVTGTGSPITLFAHGLGSGIAATRPLTGGVIGTRVLMHLRGHGSSRAPDSREPAQWTYRDFGADLRSVADHVGATRAFGVSLGAGALLTAAAADPDRFQRLVLHLPAVLDRPRSDAAQQRWDDLRALAQAADVAGIERLLSEELPPARRNDRESRAYLAARAQGLVESPAMWLPRLLVGATVLPDLSALARVRVPVLVSTQDGDLVHPVHIAEQLVAALPFAQLRVFPPAALVTARRELRAAFAGFLNDGGNVGPPSSAAGPLPAPAGR